MREIKFRVWDPVNKEMLWFEDGSFTLEHLMLGCYPDGLIRSVSTDSGRGLKMKILTLDAETQDPNLMRYGSGWCFKYHYPEVEFEVLLIGCIGWDNKKYIYSPGFKEGNVFYIY